MVSRIGQVILQSGREVQIPGRVVVLAAWPLASMDGRFLVRYEQREGLYKQGEVEGLDGLGGPGLGRPGLGEVITSLLVAKAKDAWCIELDNIVDYHPVRFTYSSELGWQTTQWLEEWQVIVAESELPTLNGEVGPLEEREEERGEERGEQAPKGTIRLLSQEETRAMGLPQRPTRVGGLPKYPWSSLAVGEGFHVPVVDGIPKYQSMKTYASIKGAKLGCKFSCRKQDDRLVVVRVA